MTNPRPANPEENTKDRLQGAALRLVARDGAGASVRAIAREAGVSEGALYRHYKSREHLIGAVFEDLVRPMIAQKEGLVAMRAPMHDRLREWVRCTYAGFDRDPNGFAFVLLTDHALPPEIAHLKGRQSQLLTELLAQGQRAGILRPMPNNLAGAMFVGLLLSVPTRVLAGKIPAPASAYTDEIARGIWLALSEEKHRAAMPEAEDTDLL